MLESFEGFVEQIDGDEAYVSLKSEFGDTLNGVYPAHKLAERGIKERRRFTCCTIDRGDHVDVELMPVSDLDVSLTEQRAIAERINRILEIDPLEGDY